MYEERTYRGYAKSDDLAQFRLVQDETDLLISADRDLRLEAEKIVKKLRMDLAKYILKTPSFETSFAPMRPGLQAPNVARLMMRYTSRLNVGPMAAVAGAIAELTGRELLRKTKQLIIENGGDIFMKTSVPRTVAVYAGNSPFSEKIALEIEPSDTPIGICASSGTVGHSFSFGRADAVVALAGSASLADAAATAIGNTIKEKGDIDTALEAAKKIKGLRGVLLIKDDKMGVWGKVRIKKI